MPIIYRPGPDHRCDVPADGRIGDIFECEYCGWMGRCRVESDSFTSAVWYQLTWLDRWLVRRQINRARVLAERDKGRAERHGVQGTTQTGTVEE